MINLLTLALIASFVLKVKTKNMERRAAEKISLILLNSKNEEMLAALWEMVPTMWVTSLVMEEFFGNLFILARPFAWMYHLLKLSTIAVDERTASVPVLWESRYELLDLRDRDILDALNEWEGALRRDVFTLFLLLATGTALAVYAF